MTGDVGLFDPGVFEGCSEGFLERFEVSPDKGMFRSPSLDELADAMSEERWAVLLLDEAMEGPAWAQDRAYERLMARQRETRAAIAMFRDYNCLDHVPDERIVEAAEEYMREADAIRRRAMARLRRAERESDPHETDVSDVMLRGDRRTLTVLPSLDTGTDVPPLSLHMREKRYLKRL